ncbi:MAG: HAMP domain-containing histidine kinase [Myxococcota bacterium]|nr:HAMP domain-containing histidine kinase [Myxococcota bacterium]
MKNDDDLLASMSHELRTPLNAILGWVQLLRAGEGCGADVDRALEIIERNAKQQAKAVDDAIDLARIANGSLPMMRKSTRWSEGLRAALAGNETSAAARGVHIEVEDSDTALRVVGDPGRLTQIARGLIASAVKRSIPGGTVRVSLGVEGSSAVLSVSEDHGAARGPEIGAAARNTGRHRRIALIGDGRGLGVSVARGLLRLHGGTLEEDDGHTLVARIPLAGSADARSEASGNAPSGAAPAPAM